MILCSFLTNNNVRMRPNLVRGSWGSCKVCDAWAQKMAQAASLPIGSLRAMTAHIPTPLTLSVHQISNNNIAFLSPYSECTYENDF